MWLGQLLNFNFDLDTAPYTPSLCWIVLYLFALNFPEAGFSADIFQQNIIYQKVVIFPLRPVTFPGLSTIHLDARLSLAKLLGANCDFDQSILHTD